MDASVAKFLQDGVNADDLARIKAQIRASDIYARDDSGDLARMYGEGLATGLAIFQSLRMARVIVAFDAGNLIHTVDHLRPTGSVVICADNVHGTEAKRGTNPGREKAANAAELIGAGVAWPEGIEGTDLADYLAEVGEGGARKMERLILAKARYVT